MGSIAGKEVADRWRLTLVMTKAVGHDDRANRLRDYCSG